MTKHFWVAVCVVPLLGLLPCASLTAKSFAVGSGYDEKKNVDVVGAQFAMNGMPMDVLQIYRNVARNDGKISFGIYNTFRDALGYKRPQMSVVAFIVEGNRTDFYSKSFGYEDISMSLIKNTRENGYFYASKPVLGNSLVANEDEQISDPDPAATDAAIVKLINSFKSAQSITIKLFGDRTDTPGYTYVISRDDLAALKDFCNTVAPSQ